MSLNPALKKKSKRNIMFSDFGRGGVCRQSFDKLRINTHVRPVRELPGWSMPVVRTLRVRVDWVRFPAARQSIL